MAGLKGGENNEPRVVGEKRAPVKSEMGRKDRKMGGWMWTIGNWKIADSGSGRPIRMCQKQVEDTVAPRGQK